MYVASLGQVVGCQELTMMGVVLETFDGYELMES